MNEKMHEKMLEKMNERVREREDAMPISCVQFEEALDDLDRAGMPAMMLRESALIHAETCGRCARLMTDTEALDFSFHEIAAHDGDLEAHPRVEAVLLQEFRLQKAEASRNKGHWRIAALATAAAVLLALGFSLRHFSVTHEVRTNTGTDVTQSAANGNSQRGAGSKAADAKTEVAENVGAENIAAENVVNDAQDASGFVSLPYATDPGTLEGGTVVRVELTRSALASMGLPVTDAGSLDRIPADIMLSEDGAPQAVRLVSLASFEQ
jgi:hypothetical protein